MKSLAIKEMDHRTSIMELKTRAWVSIKCGKDEKPRANKIKHKGDIPIKKMNWISKRVTKPKNKQTEKNLSSLNNH